MKAIPFGEIERELADLRSSADGALAGGVVGGMPPHATNASRPSRLAISTIESPSAVA